MSKIKLIINEVFEQGKRESNKATKSGLATHICDQLEKTVNFTVSEKTLIRYYERFVEESSDKTDINIEPYKLDKLSQYIGYKNFPEFSRTFVKKDDDTNKTTVKISVDQDEESLTEKLSNIIINITNEQHFKMPEFMKQNGFGIVELVFVLIMMTGTGSFVSGNSGKEENTNPLSFFGGAKDVKLKECMYWDEYEYKLAYCDDKNPQHKNIIPLDSLELRYFKKNTRPDTLTAENSMGRVWYNKSNNKVEFFMSNGKHPVNGKALRDVSERILDNYAGIQEE